MSLPEWGRQEREVLGMPHITSGEGKCVSGLPSWMSKRHPTLYAHTHKQCLNTVISISNSQLILRGCNCKCPRNWKQRPCTAHRQHRHPACGPTHHLEHRMRTSFPSSKSAENKTRNHKSEVPWTFTFTLTLESIVCLLRLVCWLHAFPLQRTEGKKLKST